MEILTAVSMLIQLTNAATNLMANASAIGEMIAKAKDAGRDKFTDAEWAEIKLLDDNARIALAAAIKQAGG